MPMFLEALLSGLRRRRAERVLSELDDRLLRDIGLTRHEVSTLGPRALGRRSSGH